MWKHILLGSGFAFAAAIQPGPLQAFLITRVMTSGWRRTLPACFAPLFSDGPIAVIALLILHRLPVSFQHGLRFAGGLLLVFLAWKTFRQWRHPSAEKGEGTAPRTFLAAALVNLLNPNPYLGWALVLGPAVLDAWRESGAHAFALVGSFYGTMIITLAAFIFLVGASRILGVRNQRLLLGLSAIFLAGLGFSMIAIAGWRLITLPGAP